MPRLQYHRILTPDFDIEGMPCSRITIANGLYDIRLHCVGEDDEEIASLELPSEPNRLRELAKGLMDSADELEVWRKGGA
jgi:hypothetical protein